MRPKAREMEHFHRQQAAQLDMDARLCVVERRGRERREEWEAEKREENARMRAERDQRAEILAELQRRRDVLQAEEEAALDRVVDL